MNAISPTAAKLAVPTHYRLRPLIEYDVYPEDPNFPGVTVSPKRRRIPDDIYAEMVRDTVVCCADLACLVENKDGTVRPEFLLARRVEWPMPGVWVYGGRHFPDLHDPKDGLATVMKREIGLTIDPDRFAALRLNYYAWNKVAQGDFPGRNGVLTFGCVISEEEADAIVPNEEYVPGSVRRYTLDDLEHEVRHNNGHPMLPRLLGFAMSALERI